MEIRTSRHQYVLETLDKGIFTVTDMNKWTKHCKNMKIGDIVTIEEDNTERSKWPLAGVNKLFYGKDGVVRSVQLKTKDSILHMSVAKLCLLEEPT